MIQSTDFVLYGAPLVGTTVRGPALKKTASAEIPSERLLTPKTPVPPKIKQATIRAESQKLATLVFQSPAQPRNQRED